MSNATKKLSLARAKQIANNLVADLAPACEPGKCVIAGSVRRLRPEVNDIEIVAVPRVEVETEEHLWDESTRYVRPLDDVLAGMCERRHLRTLKGFKPGKPWKYAQFELPHHGCNLDLFLADPDNYGWILMLRTGPENFSRNLVKPRAHGGYLPARLKCKNGRLMDSNGIAFPCLDEADVFRLLDMEPIAPEKRS